MTRILALATVMTALILAGFALAQGPYRQAEPQPNAAVEARTLTQAQTTVRQQRLEQRLDERLEQRGKAMQTARHERAMLQECDDGKPTATATRQQRGPQANW